eukprot:Sspe_Gene.75620::Locus_47250_Transcript_1_1_Confidence_1.000_Length_653::g.75620::m.75620/K09935/K09935; uncharacterized protein
MGKGGGGPCMVGDKRVMCTDNFFLSPFVLDGKEWLSAEQYFQAMKFVDPSYQEEIRRETNLSAHWRMGQTRQHRIRGDWEQNKVDVMYRANKAKFEQNAEMREELLSTTGPIRAMGFPFWAKWNGILLERIREELRPAEQQDTEKLQRRVDMMERFREETWKVETQR